MNVLRDRECSGSGQLKAASGFETVPVGFSPIVSGPRVKECMEKDVTQCMVIGQ